MIIVLYVHIKLKYLRKKLKSSRKNPNRIELSNKKLIDEIYQKLKDFKFPLQKNKTNIKKLKIF